MSVDPEQNKTTLTFLVVAFVLIPALVVAIVALRPPVLVSLLAGGFAIYGQTRLIAWYREASKAWDKPDDDNSKGFWE